MKKERIYIDTSAISYLSAPDAPDKEQDTKLLWTEFEAGRFVPIISEVTIAELESCPEPKRSFLFESLANIDFELVSETIEAVNLANDYMLRGVLTKKSKDDLRHIAIATVSRCDYIVSWNFKHFVNIKVINRVNAANKLNGYNEILILPPPMLLELEEDNEK